MSSQTWRTKLHKRLCFSWCSSKPISHFLFFSSIRTSFFFVLLYLSSFSECWNQAVAAVAVAAVAEAAASAAIEVTGGRRRTINSGNWLNSLDLRTGITLQNILRADLVIIFSLIFFSTIIYEKETRIFDT